MSPVGIAQLQDPVLAGVLESGGVTAWWDTCGIQHVSAGKLLVVLHTVVGAFPTVEELSSEDHKDA